MLDLELIDFQDVFDLPFHMARDQIEESLRNKMTSIKVGCFFLHIFISYFLLITKPRLFLLYLFFCCIWKERMVQLQDAQKGAEVTSEATERELELEAQLVEARSIIQEQVLYFSWLCKIADSKLDLGFVYFLFNSNSKWMNEFHTNTQHTYIWWFLKWYSACMFTLNFCSCFWHFALAMNVFSGFSHLKSFFGSNYLHFENFKYV